MCPGRQQHLTSSAAPAFPLPPSLVCDPATPGGCCCPQLARIDPNQEGVLPPERHHHIMRADAAGVRKAPADRTFSSPCATSEQQYVSPDKLRSRIDDLESENDELKSLLHSLQSGAAMRHTDIGRTGAFRVPSEIYTDLDLLPEQSRGVSSQAPGEGVENKEQLDPVFPKSIRGGPDSPHGGNSAAGARLSGGAAGRRRRNPGASEDIRLVADDRDPDVENLDPNQPILIGIGKAKVLNRA